MGRFENVKTTTSCKKMIPCEAGTAEYLRCDYLRPQHLPIDRVDSEVNFAAGPNIQETRFHKGFHRRHMSDIQSDAARLEVELAREQAREDRVQASLAATRELKARQTFNILTGEGVGRESEFRQVGKKVLNPFGVMEAVYGEHAKDSQSRIRSSKHRFFEYPQPQKQDRAATIFNEGLTHTVRESAILGYGKSGNSRTRTLSVGTYDNAAHTQAVPDRPPYAQARYGNRSQIVLG